MDTLSHALATFQINGDSLPAFIDALPNPAHVKDLNGRYLLSNRPNLTIHGLHRIEDIIGCTVHDLDVFMRPHWGKQFAKHKAKLDQSVIKSLNVVTAKDLTFLDISGFIRIQDIIKIPVLDQTKRLAAILTLNFEKTLEVDSIGLFNQYKHTYSNKTQAIHAFMQYLQIDKLFHADLTEKELLCLLHLCKYNPHKDVADAMNISIKTIETHLSHIMAKSNLSQLADIVAALRQRYL